MKINIIQLIKHRSISMGQSRRLVCQKVVKINGILINNIDEMVDVEIGDILTIGKHQQIEITEQFLSSIGT